MKEIVAKTSKRSSFIPDDDSVRYKLNTQYINNTKTNRTPRKQNETKKDEDNNVRYKFPPSSKLKTIEKTKPKPTIKVNFWSKKQNISRLHKNDTNKDTSSRRHTISGIMTDNKTKSTLKVRKRVSFLPTPVFNDNHIPMVTVPDDLTIQLNEEEANDLGADLNDKSVEPSNNDRTETNKRPTKNLHVQNSTKSTRGKPSFDSVDSRIGNEYELEFFSKYVVQKLRRMETNQRIYSENLINTVLMLGQLGQLNGKSKVAEN